MLVFHYLQIGIFPGGKRDYIYREEGRGVEVRPIKYTKNYFMKLSFVWPSGRQARYFLLCTTLIILFTAGCRRSADGPPGTIPADLLSSNVIDKWFTLQIRLYKNATGISNGAFARPFAYSGICAYESINPAGSWKSKYNGLSGLPEPDRNRTYYWPLAVNASLAEFNRSFFTAANSSATDIAAIDSLEASITSSFGLLSAGVADRSNKFGRSIADAVFDWSQADEYNENNLLPYTLPVGEGLWILTPPAFGKPIGPFWKDDRPIIAGSGNHAQPGPPIPYSANPKSDFYRMVNDLYKASKVLTTDQKNWALFWRDVPGLTTPGHWMSIIQQVIKQTHSPLDKAALTYALVGICMNDANISVMKTKYTYNLLRPVSYIRSVFGDTAWLSAIPTPAHPEYSSAHSVVSGAAAEALTVLYGDIGPFTDHSYDYLGFPARTFKNFRDIGVDAGNSRFYGGIHYQPSINAGLIQGKTVGLNVLNKLTGSSH